MSGFKSAVALVLAPGPRGREVLLIHRAEDPRDPWSGHMALPGGHREDGDRDLLDTAVRETFEETGVRLRRSDCVEALDDLRPRARSIPKVLIRPHVFLLERKPPVRASCEVAGILWAPLARLEGSRCRVRVPDRKIHVDAFMLGPHIVWGITYRILCTFLAKTR
ncbi:MAG: CoA pyrophosphatase [Elusimicrobiota bacterium]|jgi:8-oxo-dGTP pyrophosphatase MutT (NUDIX family)